MMGSDVIPSFTQQHGQKVSAYSGGGGKSSSSVKSTSWSLSCKNTAQVGQIRPETPVALSKMHVRVDGREGQAKLGDTLTLTYGNGGSSTALKRSGQRQAKTCGINSEARLQLVPHMSSVYRNQINVLHLCFPTK